MPSMFGGIASLEAKLKYVETEVDILKKRTDALEASLISLMNVLQEYIKKDIPDEEVADVEEGID